MSVQVLDARTDALIASPFFMTGASSFDELGDATAVCNADLVDGNGACLRWDVSFDSLDPDSVPTGTNQQDLTVGAPGYYESILSFPLKADTFACGCSGVEHTDQTVKLSFPTP